MVRICLLLLGAVSLSSLADPVTYKYDAAGRLLSADYGSAGVITYSYDKSGNLTNRTVTVPSSSNMVIRSVNVAGAAASTVQNGGIQIRTNNLVPPTTPTATNLNDAPDFVQGELPRQVQGFFFVPVKTAVPSFLPFGLPEQPPTPESSLQSGTLASAPMCSIAANSAGRAR